MGVFKFARTISHKIKKRDTVLDIPSFKESQIIMGSNVYPLPDGDKQLYDGVHFYVDMDTFEPTPSRETLRWSADDLKRLKDMQELVKQRVLEQFCENAKGRTKWEESKLFADLSSDFLEDCVKKHLLAK